MYSVAWAKSQVPDAVDRALSILNVMEQKGPPPNNYTYSSVIDAIAKSGKNPEQAEAILNRMSEAGVRPNFVTYNAVINGRFGFERARETGVLMCLTVPPFVFCSLGKVTSSQCS